jgi:hypothetical protein
MVKFNNFLLFDITLLEVLKEYGGFEKRCVELSGGGGGISVMVNDLTEHHAIKVYWGSGCIAPCILDLSTRQRWSASCTGHNGKRMK